MYQTNVNTAKILGEWVFAEDANGSDNFGYTVAMSGDGLVMCVYANGWEGTVTNQGCVYTFDRVGEDWIPRSKAGTADEMLGVIVAPSPIGTGNFGIGLSLSYDGAILVVSTPKYNATAGGVYTYLWNSGTSAWVQQGAVLTGLATVDAGDNFGRSCSISGDGLVLAVGCPAWEGPNLNQGGVLIFDWNAGTTSWDQRGSVLYNTASVTTLDDYGRGVALDHDGSVLVVVQGNNANSFMRYEWGGSSWTLMSTTTTSGGFSPCLNDDGSVLAYGTPGVTSSQGAVGIYKWNAGTSSWSLLFTITRGIPEASEEFGRGVAMSYNTRVLAVGAPYKNKYSTLPDCGVVYTHQLYLYEISGTVVDSAGAPAVRDLAVYERDTGVLVGSGVSDVSGTFSIGVSTNKECYVVVLDDDAGTVYNAKIYDLVVPL